MADARLTDAEVRAHRVAAHQLVTGAATAGKVAVLETGIQDTPPGTTAARALRARLPSGVATAGDDLRLVHGARGAMHLHRAADLPLLAAALRPDDGADLRRQQFGPFFSELPMPIGEALDEVAGAMVAVMADGVRRSKGDLSTAIQATVDPRLRPWCAGCAAHHVHDALFRLASLPAGLHLLSNGDGSADFIAGGPLGAADKRAADNAGGPAGPAGAAGGPAAQTSAASVPAAPTRAASSPAGMAGAASVPAAPTRAASSPAGMAGAASGPAQAGAPPARGAEGSGDCRRELVRRFLRYTGPTNRDGLASWLALSPTAARRWWDLADVVPVEVGGRRLYLHPDDLDAARAAPPASGAHLLPPYDPILELSDRHLLLPDPAARKQVWRATANPGVVLADGAVAGIWRRRGGTITVTPLAPLSATHRRALATAADEEVVVAES